MNQRKILLLSILFFTSMSVYCQRQDVELITLFSQRLDNPIKLEVSVRDDQIVFEAFNRSFYPYQLSINFSMLTNLTPESLNRDFVIIPGKNSLFTLSVKNRQLAPDFQYSWSYRIGDPYTNPDLSYPYLIPVSPYKSFKLVYFADDSDIFIRNAFKLDKGDTVYCMRKGYVTAVPEMFNKSDRISDMETLEIRHEDGTVMIYRNLNPDSVYARLGDKVYPNQPLGLINDNMILDVNLYMFQKESSLKRLNINYYLGPGKTGPFTPDMVKFKSEYPVEIITREMSKTEKRKFITNKL